MTNLYKNSTSLLHTGKEHIINAHLIKESDKPVENTDITNRIFMEQTMPDITNLNDQTETNGYKVILQFPGQSELKDTEQQEIQTLLQTILQDQLVQMM